MSSEKYYVLPNKFANTAIWLRGDMGKTIVQPTLASPDNLTTWSVDASGITAALTGVYTPDGHQYNSLTTGTNTSERIYKLASNYSASVSTAFSWYVKGSGWVFLHSDSFVSRVWFNIGTGAIGSSIGGGIGTTTELGDGGFNITATLPGTGGYSQLRIVDGDGISTWSGGAGTVINATYARELQAGVVSDWANQGNDTSRLSSVSQATFAKMPFVSTLNDLPALYFNGANSLVTTVFSGAGALAQPNTIFAVATTKSTGTTAIVDAPTSREVIYTTGASFPKNLNIYASANISKVSVISSGVPYVIAGVLNGTSSNIYINGTSVNTGDPGADALNGLTIGAYTSGSSQFHTGYIAEVIVYNGDAVAEGVMDQINYYLKTFWRIG